MRRRELMLLLGGMVTAPRILRARQKAMPVIGVLGWGDPDYPAIVLNLAGFRAGLKQAGFVERQNVIIEYRWAYEDEKRLPALAAELVARGVDVIVTEGGLLTARAAKNATATIPIVFATGDAILDGIVGNLARPGGNLTGVSLFAPEIQVKQFQLLSELVPAAKMLAALTIPTGSVPETGQMEEAARTSGVELEKINLGMDVTNNELDVVYAKLAERRAGVIVRAIGALADKLVALAARHRVPAVYSQRRFAEVGGLLSYGFSFPAVYRIKGVYAGKILSGDKPGDLPVQQPDRFELLVNLKTAKSLGLTIPQSILARADEVIE